MSDAFDGLDEAQARLLRSAPAPDHAGAMPAVLTRERFSDPGWIFERKLDGIRCVAIRAEDRLRMLSRNDLSLNSRYPELARALAHQRCERFAVDGEIVAFEGSRTEFGALLMGYYSGDELRYSGKVGAGFDQATLAELGAKLRGMRRPAPAFSDPATIRERQVTWVEPELVAQVGFAEWTPGGRLRHPRFLGLRDDKPARSVVREQ